ncbi:hypothetical protein ECEC1856_3500, partial [Escherichia coli EC1856]
MILILKR